MKPGNFEIFPDTHVAAVFKQGASFSLNAPAGDFDEGRFASAYADAIVDRMKEHGYVDVTVDHDSHGFRIEAFNPDGSSLDVGFSVNDRLGLDVDYASGISVQNGNDVNLTSGVWEFPDEFGYDALEDFLSYFKGW